MVPVVLKILGIKEICFNNNAVCHLKYLKSLNVKNVNVAKNCKILSYNISGLSNKNLYTNFFEFINNFDLIFLYETFMSETSLINYENKFQNYGRSNNLFKIILFN